MAHLPYVYRWNRMERKGPRDVHWTEFWRDCEQVPAESTPPCDAWLEVRS